MTTNLQDQIAALKSRMDEVTASATAEDLVYLAKAAEAIAGQTSVLDLEEIGVEKVAAITAEGDTQVSRVTTEGDTQHGRIVAEGDNQVARVSGAAAFDGLTAGLVPVPANAAEQAGFLKGDGTWGDVIAANVPVGAVVYLDPEADTTGYLRLTPSLVQRTAYPDLGALIGAPKTIVHGNVYSTIGECEGAEWLAFSRDKSLWGCIGHTDADYFFSNIPGAPAQTTLGLPVGSLNYTYARMTDNGLYGVFWFNNTNATDAPHGVLVTDGITVHDLSGQVTGLSSVDYSEGACMAVGTHLIFVFRDSTGLHWYFVDEADPATLHPCTVPSFTGGDFRGYWTDGVTAISLWADVNGNSDSEYVLYSGDGGETWVTAHVNSNTVDEFAAYTYPDGWRDFYTVEANDQYRPITVVNARLFVRCTGGFLISEDGGQSFTEYDNPSGFSRVHSIWHIAEDGLYYATGYGTTLLMSSPDLTTWTLIATRDLVGVTSSDAASSVFFRRHGSYYMGVHGSDYFYWKRNPDLSSGGWETVTNVHCNYTARLLLNEDDDVYLITSGDEPWVGDLSDPDFPRSTSLGGDHFDGGLFHDGALFMLYNNPGTIREVPVYAYDPATEFPLPSMSTESATFSSGTVGSLSRTYAPYIKAVT